MNESHFQAVKKSLLPQTKPMKKRPITGGPLVFVIGIHRTLSSCLAKCLEGLGVWFGPGAGGEERELTWLCETLCPFPTRRPTIGEGSVRELLDGWLTRLRSRAPEDAVLGAKYPTMCFFAEDLEVVADPIIVSCHRRLEDSIQSLVDRSARNDPRGWANGSAADCEALQIELYRRQAEFLAYRPHCRVVAEDLLADPAAELRRIAKYLAPLGLVIPEEKIAAAAATVSLDRAPHTTRLSDEWIGQTEILIKAGGRDRCLSDLIASIRAYYPGAAIAVGDDSPSPRVRQDVERFLILPEDCGLAYARNHLVQTSTRPYVVLMDDDFLVTERTRIDRLWDALHSGGPNQYDLVAGRVHRPVDIPNYFGRLAVADGVLRIEPVDAVAEASHCDLNVMENFFIASRAALLRCPWDARLKVGEHLDWCLRAKYGSDPPLRIAALPEVEVLDRSTRPTGDYARARARAKHYWGESLQRWGRRLGFDRLDNGIYPSRWSASH
jgi:hypothetical protein